MSSIRVLSVFHPWLIRGTPMKTIILMSLSVFICVHLWLNSAPAAEPCVSGLKAGERPGPYSSVICTGAQRGQSFCYICDNADRPAVVVFARTLSEPLGKLTKQLDKAVQDNAAVKLNGWVSFLNKDQASL